MKTDNYLQLAGFIISYDHLYWSTVTHDIVVCGYFKKRSPGAMFHQFHLY
jgi:hypothetical protein